MFLMVIWKRYEKQRPGHDLQVDEIGDYVAHRLRIAGYRGDDLFGANAFGLIGAGIMGERMLRADPDELDSSQPRR